MDAVGAIANVVAALVAIGAASIALLQLRRGQREARATRTAELSWNIYLAYDSERVREGRQFLELVSHREPVPKNGEEYLSMYRAGFGKGSRSSVAQTDRELVSGTHVRAILRYYQQVGILLEQGLIDAGFIFPLIGSGLDSSSVGIRSTVDYYQRYYGGESGRELAPKRDLYEYAIRLLDGYHDWKRGTGSSGRPVSPQLSPSEDSHGSSA